MTNCVIVRYSEIGLKGGNKSDFELRLVGNIKDRLKSEGIKAKSIKRLFSRIIVITDDAPDMRCVFGIASYSYAKIIPPSLEEIKAAVIPMIKDYNVNTTFRISAKRLDKNFPLDSMGVEREVGAFIVQKTDTKVNLKNFEKEIGIEMLKNEFIIYDKKIKASGGLPVGIEGKALALIDDENSIKAAVLAMKRGCEVFPVAFNDVNIEELKKYSSRIFAAEKVKDMEEVNNFAKKINAKALVVGQTIKNFKEIKTTLLVLRPMIASE